MADAAAPYRLKTTLVALVFVVIGLIALIASIEIDPKHELLRAVLRELATITVIGATLHTIYELYQRKDFAEITNAKAEQVLAAVAAGQENIVSRMAAHEVEVLSRLNIANQARQIGITEITRDARMYDFADLFGAQRMTAVLNDGRTWVSNNAPKLRARLADATKMTTLYVIHPESPMIAVMARKEGTTVEAVRMKIDETLRLLSSLMVEGTNLKVFGHMLFNPHTLYMCESFAVVTPYFHARARRSTPAIRYDDTSHLSLYRELQADLEALALDALELSLTGRSSSSSPDAA